MDNAGRNPGFAPLVVDSPSPGNSLCFGVDLSLLHRAQQAGVLWSSLVVLVGGSAHGGAHTCRENGAGNSEVLFGKQKYGMNWRMSPQVNLRDGLEATNLV